jgi:hypothetical protein
MNIRKLDMKDTGVISEQDRRLESTAREFLFDEEWYRAQLTESEESCGDAFQHFLQSGVYERLSPHPLFDVGHYQNSFQDGQDSQNPVLHFLAEGWKTGNSPSVDFDFNFYLSEYPDIRQSNINPLLHFLQYGAFEGRKPNAGFDTAWYILNNPGLVERGVNPFLHWLKVGRHKGVSRNATEELVRRQKLLMRNTDVFAPPTNRPPVADHSSSDHVTPPPTDVDNGFAALGENDAALFSFDVWDTLLRRRCHPDEIKLQTARYLLLEFHHHLRPLFRSVQSLYRARQRAEGLSAPHGDWEFRLKDAILYWVNEVAEPSLGDRPRLEIAERLNAYEIAS